VPETPPLEGGHLLRARNDSLKTGDKVKKVGLEKEGDEGGRGERGREGERRREKEREGEDLQHSTTLYLHCS
jgi:hypothetical protein